MQQNIMEGIWSYHNCLLGKDGEEKTKQKMRKRKRKRKRKGGGLGNQERKIKETMEKTRYFRKQKRKVE